jgi:two-component system response regulator FlrC
MHGLEFGSDIAGKHAPLVQRAAAIVGALGQGVSVLLRDAGDVAATATSAACITLDRLGDRSVQPGIVRGASERATTLRYADPASEASLAGLIACVARTGEPIAADAESLSILALAERLAVSDIPVLINGPTGTGKEVLSRFIHNRSNRKDRPFVAVNCAAMPEAMLEALLFGHKKGAFTGATDANEGFFRAAHGGTLLLDEIAEMPLGLQAKLLRAQQEGEVVPIGATQPIKVDVRVIACANRDLPSEVAEGRFRADLYYRLNVFPLALRPLRERLDDIAPLAFAMLLRHTPFGQTVPWIGDAALAMLKLHGWPGNVRELENVMRRAILLAHGAAEIKPEHISFDSPARLVSNEPAPVQEVQVHQIPSGRRRLSNIVQISEARAIMETLEACGGNRVAAASQLGISERTLRYRLASFREAGLAVAGAAR